MRWKCYLHLIHGRGRGELSEMEVGVEDINKIYAFKRLYSIWPARLIRICLLSKMDALLGTGTLMVGDTKVISKSSGTSLISQMIQ